MARSERDALKELAERWKREAFGYEQDARRGDYSQMERRLLQMHARVKHADADELKRELEKVQKEYLQLAARLWAGTVALDAQSMKDRDIFDFLGYE